MQRGRGLVLFIYFKCLKNFTNIIYPNLRRCDTRSPSKSRFNERKRGERTHKRGKKRI